MIITTMTTMMNSRRIVSWAMVFMLTTVSGISASPAPAITDVETTLLRGRVGGDSESDKLWTFPTTTTTIKTTTTTTRERSLQPKLPECGFDQYSCRGTVWRSCRALADRIDDDDDDDDDNDVWCYNLVEDANVCCGEYTDCCENDKVLFTVVIGAALLTLSCSILACCWWIPVCPLHVVWEERQRQLAHAKQAKEVREMRKKEQGTTGCVTKRPKSSTGKEQNQRLEMIVSPKREQFICER
mmetsp:Transcript_6723/g.13860  ORF Transcript_6723/g.13860 Transcript_6723/m.13860 type:complete len:242 (-) Transcript_6723:119-844(-)